MFAYNSMGGNVTEQSDVSCLCSVFCLIVCVWACVFEQWKHIRSPLTSKNSSFSILAKNIFAIEMRQSEHLLSLLWCTLFSFLSARAKEFKFSTFAKLSEYVKIFGCCVSCWNHFYAKSSTIYILYSVFQDVLW